MTAFFCLLKTTVGEPVEIFGLSIQEFFKVAPGLALFPLTGYLAWKKFGTSVSCDVVLTSSHFLPNRFSSLVLSNNKDRPVTIFEVIVVVEDHIQLLVEKFDPPLVLKSLETVSISTTPYSSLRVGGEDWELGALSTSKMDFYIGVPGGYKKCAALRRPMMLDPIRMSDYVTAERETATYNGKVLSSSVRFILVYLHDKESRTSFISHHGMLDEYVGLPFSLLPHEALVSAEILTDYIKSALPELKFSVHPSRMSFKIKEVDQKI